MIDLIQRVVASHYGIPLADMLSHRRAVSVAHPRQVAMYLAKKFTKESYTAIGRAFDRDHTTALYAYNKLAAACIMDDMAWLEVYEVWQKVRIALQAESAKKICIKRKESMRKTQDKYQQIVLECGL